MENYAHLPKASYDMSFTLWKDRELQQLSNELDANWAWCKLSCCFSSLLAFEMCRFVWLRSGEHKYITLWTWSQVRHQTRMSSIKLNQVRLSKARLSGIRHQGYVICMRICCGMAPTKALSVCRWVFTSCCRCFGQFQSRVGLESRGVSLESEESEVSHCNINDL